jgi:N utilization substance protein A
MKSDFMLAINQLCAERKLSRDVVLEAVEAALISAYRRNFGSATNIEARIEPNTGEVQVFALKEVVETVQDRKTQISVDEVGRIDPDVKLGETVRVESTPQDFGRIAAQTAKQVILQRIREAERDAQYSAFADSAGEIALGTVQSVDYHSGDVIVNLDGAEAILPAREQVPNERYRRGNRLRAYVVDVRRGNRGPRIMLSRRSPALLRRLLELEVPEIFNGTVEIKAIAREAGSRSKVAVHATQEGVDPVGSCVGVRGGRIQSVVNELGGEKIDVVQWDPEVSGFIANALSPAKVMNVLLSDDPDTGKTATVIVPDRQLSLAIGKEGQNARLAAKLTGWRIDIKSATETAEETLGRLEEAALSPEDMDLLSLAESLLRKREEDKFSEEEIALIKADIGVQPAGDGPAPAETEQPLAAEEVAEEVAHAAEPISPAEEVLAEPTMAAEVEAGERDFVDAESAEARDAKELLAGEVAAAEEAAAGADQPVAEEGVEAEGKAPDEVELETPFEGEPIEDSLGWVSTEPPEEFQYDYDWEEPAWEEAEAEKEEDWEPEELEELRKGKKKKGRRRRGKSDFDYELDDVYDPKWR